MPAQQNDVNALARLAARHGWKDWPKKWSTRVGETWVNIWKDTGRVSVKVAGRWHNDDDLLACGLQDVETWYAGIKRELAGGAPGAVQATTAIAPRRAEKTAEIAEFERLDNEQILEAVREGAILEEFFYTLRRGGHQVTGLSYAGALQCRAAWNAAHPDDEMVIGEPVWDEMSARVLGDGWICIVVPAWFAHAPDNRVFGRAAARVDTFRVANTLQYAVTVVEHKAMRNAIKMLTPPREILQAQRAYVELKRQLVADGVVESPDAIAYKERPSLPEARAVAKEVPPAPASVPVEPTGPADVAGVDGDELDAILDGLDLDGDGVEGR
jgi:hypothetical protein